jgi:hypothetical protein
MPLPAENNQTDKETSSIMLLPYNSHLKVSAGDLPIRIHPVCFIFIFQVRK